MTCGTECPKGHSLGKDVGSQSGQEGFWRAEGKSSLWGVRPGWKAFIDRGQMANNMEVEVIQDG